MASSSGNQHGALFSGLLSRKTLASAVSGSAASMLSMALMYPLDRVRAVKQLGGSNEAKNEGITQVLLRIIREEGWGGLYAGLLPMLVALGTSNLVFFYWEAALKAAVIFLRQKNALSGTNPSDISTATSLTIATIAGVINVFLTTPLWIAYTRITTQNRIEQEKVIAATLLKRGSQESLVVSQSLKSRSPSLSARKHEKKEEEPEDATPKKSIEVKRKHRYRGIFDCLVRVAQEEGVKELWSGLGPSLLLVSNPTLQFVAYSKMRAAMISYVTGPSITSDPWNALDDESMKSLMSTTDQESKKLVQQSIERSVPDLSDYQYLLIGGLSKLFATILTYPIQVAQTRLRADAAPTTDGTKKSKKYNGTFHCLWTIYQEEGIEGLYKGMNAKIIQTCLTSAFMFLFYERISCVIFRIMLRHKFKVKQ